MVCPRMGSGPDPIRADHIHKVCPRMWSDTHTHTEHLFPEWFRLTTRLMTHLTSGEPGSGREGGRRAFLGSRFDKCCPLLLSLFTTVKVYLHQL